ncbi:hypothetical protein L6164_026806 [Bauhinia variegata]|uniref:Uncharacterized protein n=1 Tax=Bauhinia variegata TaxID=167791 RepID=A0ACB9LRN1_BAUVA|nr:hypothetical protein L6164_026806 [Bauhinia variegata]
MMLHFGQPAKLKTKRIVFEDVFAVCDSATLEQLKELSAKRRAIEESINESSFITEAIAKEMSGGLVSRIEQLTACVVSIGNNYRMVQWTSSLKIRWSSALSSSSIFNLMGPKFFQIDNLRFELGMTHFLYAAILRERALEVLSTARVTSEKPPEALAAISTIMILICLAEAQAVTTRKAEEKGSSSSLLAKLHHGVTLFLNEAIGVLNTGIREYKDISPCLLEFISCCKSLHELKGQKCFAEIDDASEVLRKYVYENDNVWREKIPAADELPLPQALQLLVARLSSRSCKYGCTVQFSSPEQTISDQESPFLLNPFHLKSWQLRLLSSALSLKSSTSRWGRIVSAVVSEEKAIGSSFSAAEVFKLISRREQLTVECEWNNILVDPILIGNLDFGIPWPYDAAKKVLKNFQLNDLPEVDCLLITESLDDHCPLKTLKPLSEKAPNLKLLQLLMPRSCWVPFFNNDQELAIGGSGDGGGEGRKFRHAKTAEAGPSLREMKEKLRVLGFCRKRIGRKDKKREEARACMVRRPRFVGCLSQLSVSEMTGHNKQWQVTEN